MSTRTRNVRSARAAFLLATALLPILAACSSSGGGGSSPDRAQPEVERDPASAATLPKAPAIGINTAANDSERGFPLDATPSPDGKSVYYIALTNDAAGDRVASVFRTSADGGAVQALASGAPLASPVGITTSQDGSTLFVADPGSEGGGAVLSIPEGGGAATPVGGTAGYRPQGIVLGVVKERAALYFTGFSPDSGEAGVFSLDPNGGEVTTIATGSPLVAPGGIVVLKSGDVYVADSASANGSAAVLKVSDGTVSSFLDHIGVGFPAGITATSDDSTVLVSGLDPATKSDVVYFVEVSTGKLSALTETINAFGSPAGVHRALDTDVFAWADSRANDTGTVYTLK